MFRARVDEIHEASTAVELGKEDCSIGLGLGVFDPLQAGSDAAVLTAALAENPATIAAHPHGDLLLYLLEVWWGSFRFWDEEE